MNQRTRSVDHFNGQQGECEELNVSLSELTDHDSLTYILYSLSNNRMLSIYVKMYGVIVVVILISVVHCLVHV